MSMDGKLLADGQVATTESVIYTVPANSTAFIKSVSFHNTNAATQTLIMYVRNGASASRAVARWSLKQNETAFYNASLALEDGDTIRAVTTTANAVDYVITGVLQL
jgi:hypothetical protein